jgi:tetratricopeptide (TPR) repeat protein
MMSAVLLAGTAAAGAAGQAAAKAPVQTADRAAVLQQAADAQRAGRTEEAVRLLRLAGERYHSVQAWLDLARLQSRGGNLAAALDSLSTARRLAPNAEDVLSAYAQLSLAAKMPVPAVLTLQSLTRVYPAVAQYHYLLGVGLMAIGDMPSAIESLTAADRLEPNRALTLLALGLAWNNRKMFTEAKTALAHSLELQADSTETIAALAEAEIGLGDYDRAAVYAQQALVRAPANATANLSIGMERLHRGKYDEARDALLKAAAADPESPKAAYQLSLVYARLGDEATAQHYVELYQQKLRAVEKQIDALRERKQ